MGAFFGVPLVGLCALGISLSLLEKISLLARGILDKEVLPEAESSKKTLAGGEGAATREPAPYLLLFRAALCDCLIVFVIVCVYSYSRSSKCLVLCVGVPSSSECRVAC